MNIYDFINEENGKKHVVTMFNPSEKNKKFYKGLGFTAVMHTSIRGWVKSLDEENVSDGEALDMLISLMDGEKVDTYVED